MHCSVDVTVQCIIQTDASIHCPPPLPPPHLFELHHVDMTQAGLQLDLAPHLLRTQSKIMAAAAVKRFKCTSAHQSMQQ